MDTAATEYFFPSSPWRLAVAAPALWSLVFLLFLATNIIAPVYRYRRVSTLVQRQQTKWVVFGVTAALVSLALLIAPALVDPALDRPGTLYHIVVETAVYVVMLLIPLSIGMAILRARLFEIDVIINRTLVYGALTGLLAAVYFASVVVLQSLFRAVAGQDSNLAIVVATLAAAGLFQPLRGRVQQFIDRRFYRRKYDAVQILAAFSARLRDEVDLDELRADLLAVVREAMQPERASLWLRPAP